MNGWVQIKEKETIFIKFLLGSVVQEREDVCNRGFHIVVIEGIRVTIVWIMLIAIKKSL